MNKLNARQERFCQALVGGMSATQAYVAAGFTSKNPGVHAGQLVKNSKVQARLDELRANTAQAAQKSREDILSDLAKVYDGAMANEAYGPAVASLTQYSKMCGYDAPAKVEADVTVQRIARTIVDPRK